MNYAGLKALYEKYKADGFTFCAFPCNQFGGQVGFAVACNHRPLMKSSLSLSQAPGTSQEEREWAFKKVGYEFDVFDKIDVNGASAHPLYKYLKAELPSSGPSPSRPGGDIE